MLRIELRGAGTTMEHKKIIINETVVSYLTAGKGEQSIIFLHGWRSNKEVWMPIAKLMQNSGYRLFFIDLPGFGASETPKKPYTLHNYTETVRLFIEKLNIQVNALVGHSFGARVAVKLAAEHPDILQKLVLVASGGARPRFAVLSKIAAKIFKPFFAPRFMTPLRKKIYNAMGADDYLATPELQATFLNIVNENLDPLLSNIITDTLIMWGDKDTTVPLAYGKHMKKIIPNARLEIIKDAGHYCFSEQSEKFASILTAFISH